MGPVIAQAQPDTPLRALGRYLIFIGSAALSVVAFWLWTDSWLLGVGIVALLFVHEMGHFIVIRAKGLPASLPVFIPLLGAYVTMRQAPRNVRDEAEIALAGPIAGGLAGLGCLALYQVTGERALITLAYLTFFINLLNLVPISPLDGGRVVGAISRWLWPIGMARRRRCFLLLLGSRYPALDSAARRDFWLRPDGWALRHARAATIRITRSRLARACT